jgi:hypothetical protein
MVSRGLDVPVWSAIVTAVDEILGDLERTLRGGAFELGALYRRTCLRLDALRVTLETSLSAAETRRILVPLTFLIDERALALLPDRSLDRRVAWPLLQSKIADTDFGGDAFYEEMERLLDPSDRWPLAIQVYLYCLARGFGGRYADMPAQLEATRQRLWNALPPVSLPEPIAPVEGATPPLGRWYQAAIVVALVALWHGAWAWLEA